MVEQPGQVVPPQKEKAVPHADLPVLTTPGMGKGSERQAELQIASMPKLPGSHLSWVWSRNIGSTYSGCQWGPGVIVQGKQEAESLTVASSLVALQQSEAELSSRNKTAAAAEVAAPAARSRQGLGVANQMLPATRLRQLRGEWAWKMFIVGGGG